MATIINGSCNISLNGQMEILITRRHDLIDITVHTIIQQEKFFFSFFFFFETEHKTNNIIRG